MTDPDDPNEIRIRDFDLGPDHLQTRERERVRGRLAHYVLGLVGLIALVLIGGVITGHLTIPMAKELAAMFFQPFIPIFVGIVAFFFGRSR